MVLLQSHVCFLAFTNLFSRQNPATYPPPPLFICWCTPLRSMLHIVDQIYRFEVTWLGLHAFREVFGAFSKKDRGFTRCKLDMEKALVDAAGSTGGAVVGVGEKRNDRGRGKPPAAGDEEEEEEEEGLRRRGEERATAKSARRGGAYNRLRHVVRSPDALSLLRTLTT